MELPVLKDIVVVFGLSIAVLLACHRLKIPSIIGFILTGILAGPFGGGLIGATEQVDVLAKVGLIFLLFTIGMEFSPGRMFKMRKDFFLGGGLQVALTVAGGFFISICFGRPFLEAIFLGFLLSLSSTAIVLKMLVDRGEVKTRCGKLAVAILIFQDVSIIAMMLITPFLAGNFDLTVDTLIWALAKAVFIIGIVLFLAINVVPYLMDTVAKTRSRELFLLTILLICFGVTLGASYAGLSITIGAFLAGMALSDSEYRHHALGNILPFQDIFTSFFFISIGMLLDISYVAENLLLILAAAFGVILLKITIVGLASLVVGFAFAEAMQVGFILAQVGEFSFILAGLGIKEGIGEEYLYQLFLALSLFSMLFTPLLFVLGNKISRVLKNRQPYENSGNNELDEMMEGHVIIAGFGKSGKHVAAALKLVNMDYVILEIDPEIVLFEKTQGESIFFGDAAHASVLKHAGILSAQAFVVVIDNPQDESRIIESVKKIRSDLPIILRTRRVKERDSHFLKGAEDVIVDEVEASITLVTKLLQKFRVPLASIDKVVNELSETLIEPRSAFAGLQESGIEVISVEEGARYVNQSVTGSDLRKEFGVTVLALSRANGESVDVRADTIFQIGDNVILFGLKDRLLEARVGFKALA